MWPSSLVHRKKIVVSTPRILKLGTSLSAYTSSDLYLLKSFHQIPNRITKLVILFHFLPLSSTVSMTPIEECSNKDMKNSRDPGLVRRRSLDTGMAPSSTPPATVTPKLVFTNAGRTLPPLGSSHSSKSLGIPSARKSCSNLCDLDAFSEPTSPPLTPLTPMTPSTMIITNTGKTLAVSSSGKHLTGWIKGSSSSKSLGYSESLKLHQQKKMYVKQVTGKFNDTELHLAAKSGDVQAVRDILEEIETTSSETEMAEIQTAIVNETNEINETPLFIAAEKGHLEVVKVLLPHVTKDGILIKSRSGLDPLHVAATQGHTEIVRVLLDYDRGLCRTFGQSNATPLISAATRGHTEIVNILLEKDSSLICLTKNNGKNALHFAVRQGHADITEALLNKDPLLARKTDKKGQTALHMAVKGHSCEVVKLLLRVDPSTVMLPDTRFGNVALHIATRKKRVEIVKELLFLTEIDVNALNRAKKTALDIVDDLLYSEETSEIKDILVQCGALRANELNQPNELKQTMSEIQKKVHNQLEQARRTNKNVHGIAKDLKKLHREGVNNTTNSVTVVAVLLATVAFAALFTVPGGNYDNGLAVMVNQEAFKVFFISNALSLFTSLSVVVVQMTLVRGETKTEKRVVQVINKLMWMAAICTTVAFTSSSYIIVGKHHKWAAIIVTVFGGAIMAGVLGSMTYCVLKHKTMKKKIRWIEKTAKLEGIDDKELTELEAIYAI